MYMLDTNMVSAVMSNQPGIRQHLSVAGTVSTCISAITLGEMMYGLRKRPGRVREQVAREFLLRVEVLPWTESVAECCGVLRADLSRQGIVLGALDMQIAAHAKAEGCVLVTADKAFHQVPELSVTNWLQTS
ncbi:MAG: type II toxin-antitoxin system VapC family toxin [Alcanivoracaceae bacterium]